MKEEIEKIEKIVRKRENLCVWGERRKNKKYIDYLSLLIKMRLKKSKYHKTNEG